MSLKAQSTAISSDTQQLHAAPLHHFYSITIIFDLVVRQNEIHVNIISAHIVTARALFSSLSFLF